ncbi:type IV secretory system conjugative DNA transfer family protein, partial [Frankia sp. Cj3]|uniref:type IV secretory system conjugative DNA transfer family protein n=1 Tax=Frankia sp. Cj3 TaxID=2880976 RepID=UPI001EF433BD
DPETAAVQILARPVTGRRLTLARRAAARHRGQHTPSPLSRLLDLATPRTGRRPDPAGIRRPSGPTPPEDSAASRAIGIKAVQPRWEATLTYAAASRTRPADRTGRRHTLRGLRGRAHTLASAFHLYAGHNYLRRLAVSDPVGMLAGRRLHRGDLLAVDELAALAHLPADVDVPGLARAGAAAVPPPVGVPTPRPGTAGVKLLGDADAGRPRPVGLTVADARHHLHVLGATGSGKSTLLTRLILDDAAAGRAVAVIDPKGDLIRDIEARLPAGLGGRLTVIDPDRPGPPPCVNILDGADAGLATDQLLSICRRIWADSWGPRTDDLLRAACLTLLTPTPARAGRAATLVEVTRLLTDPAFRRRATTGVSDPILAGFWTWYAQLSDGARAQAVGPVMNKLRALLLRPFVRAALAAGPSTVNLTRILDGGGILLVRIPKGAVGDDACAVFGSIVLAKIWQATLARTRRPPAGRPDAAVYLDEAHNFLTLPGGLADILAEARGLHLSLTLAHQHLAQLPKDLADAVAANARNKIFFACSPQDATVLARHTAPTLGAHDLAHLPAFTAAARLVVAAQPTAAFTLRTRPLPAPRPGRP